ncbi:hypothetical protein SsS58_05772 [Streptomyces scabiei]|uniref:Uncharacterized protein n=1 Tax=Streptomyces scabiei TaxID=1930 RepID=A0A124C4S5_STRSC|nr:hypothetical protein SsS58_05772 [Streptomyces scabiei]
MGCPWGDVDRTPCPRQRAPAAPAVQLPLLGRLLAKLDKWAAPWGN